MACITVTGCGSASVRFVVRLFITIDEFVQTRVLPEFQPVVLLLRELMRETAPDVTEEIRHGIPAFRAKRIIAVISPRKNGIMFAFSHGPEIEDTYGLLQSKGKVSKHVKIKIMASINWDALRYYIRQALEFEV